MYTLYPRLSLVKNNGTKNGENSKFDLQNLSSSFSNIRPKILLKQKILEDYQARKVIENFFNRNILYKIKEAIINLLNVK
jgi:hypothetical protein